MRKCPTLLIDGATIKAEGLGKVLGAHRRFRDKSVYIAWFNGVECTPSTIIAITYARQGWATSLPIKVSYRPAPRERTR